jgi:hypothetical protein
MPRKAIAPTARAHMRISAELRERLDVECARLSLQPSDLLAAMADVWFSTPEAKRDKAAAPHREPSLPVRIIAILGEYTEADPCRATEIVTRTGAPLTAVNSALSRLVDGGEARRVRWGRYVLA